MSIVITTPTGNIGNRVLQQLVQTDAEISVLVRQPEKLSDAIRQRVNIHQGTLNDAAVVANAFKGAKAVLWVTPGDVTQEDVKAYASELGQIAAAAIKQNNVPYVVNISSTGAQLPNAGPVSGLGLVERFLNEAAQNIVHLRPGFFMENFLMDIASIRQDGAIYYPLPSETSFPMIATKDIADVAAQLLRNIDWRGQQIRGLHGPEHLAFAEAAHILGESLGKPVTHVQITPEQAFEAYTSFGISPGAAQAFVEMYQALAQPGAMAEPRTTQTTTPTSLRAWGDVVLRPLLATA